MSPAKQHERLGFFLHAAMKLADDGLVLCRFVQADREYRVTVRRDGAEKVAVSRDSPLIAMGLAVEWLQRSRRSSER